MDILFQLFFFISIIPSAIIHEYMHGWAANQLGDPTAKYAGRLTLDPRAHVDPMGTFVLPLLLFFVSGGRFLFAYAKPVPYNPYNLRKGKWGPVLVALAGPLSNFFLAAVFGMFMQILPVGNLTIFLSIIVYTNILLGVFNLIPLPPLDGSKLLFAVLPPSMHHLKITLERYGIWILFALIFLFPGVYQSIVLPAMMGLYSLFTGGAGLF